MDGGTITGTRWSRSSPSRAPARLARMLSRYSHVRMEAKRRALDEIAARQCAADVKRNDEVVRKQAAEPVVSHAAVVQQGPPGKCSGPLITTSAGFTRLSA